jgi:hypothetical protein
MRPLAALAIVIGLVAMRAIVDDPLEAGGTVTLTALSSDPDMVTGGDVLMEVTLPPGTPRGELRVTANGRDATTAFRPARMMDTFVGLVTGLSLGTNTIVAEAGHLSTTLRVTNYSSSGPMFSGLARLPRSCQTERMLLPDGTHLGPAATSDCSVQPVVQYVYRPARSAPGSPPFLPLPRSASAPLDVVRTTTAAAQTVNVIVRVETGTVNRAVYQTAILHDPTSEAPLSPLSAPRGWNRRLEVVHRGACATEPSATAGRGPLDALDADALSRGDALLTLIDDDVAGGCGVLRTVETTMMAKERFIETFGAPDDTVDARRARVALPGNAHTIDAVRPSIPRPAPRVSASSRR